MIELVVGLIVFLAVCQLFFIRKYVRRLAILKQKEMNLTDAEIQQLSDSAGLWRSVAEKRN